MSTRTRLSYRDFVCPAGHTFKCAVASRLTDSDRVELFYQPIGMYAELPIPKCPRANCTLIGEEEGNSGRSYMQVPSEERFEAWLSPDGQWLSVPTEKGREMPQRYKNAGYIKVEATNIRDLDRFDSIRARQTGNEVWNEMNYSPGARREHEELDYTDDPTSIV